MNSYDLHYHYRHLYTFTEIDDMLNYLFTMCKKSDVFISAFQVKLNKSTIWSNLIMYPITTQCKSIMITNTPDGKTIDLYKISQINSQNAKPLSFDIPLPESKIKTDYRFHSSSSDTDSDTKFWFDKKNKKRDRKTKKIQSQLSNNVNLHDYYYPSYSHTSQNDYAISLARQYAQAKADPYWSSSNGKEKDVSSSVTPTHSTFNQYDNPPIYSNFYEDIDEHDDDFNFMNDEPNDLDTKDEMEDFILLKEAFFDNLIEHPYDKNKAYNMDESLLWSMYHKGQLQETVSTMKALEQEFATFQQLCQFYRL